MKPSCDFPGDLIFIFAHSSGSTNLVKQYKSTYVRNKVPNPTQAARQMANAANDNANDIDLDEVSVIEIDSESDSSRIVTPVLRGNFLTIRLYETLIELRSQIREHARTNTSESLRQTERAALLIARTARELLELPGAEYDNVSTTSELSSESEAGDSRRQQSQPSTTQH